MKILAIETSCDDTCIAVIEADRRGYQRGKTRIQFKILSNIVSSQAKIHKKYGGVWPFLAKREHRKNLPIVLKKALRQAQSKQKFEKPGLIAVTMGPGLEPCLWEGVNFAKELAEKMKLPIIPVNHIEAHILVNFLPKINEISNFKFQISKQFQNPNFKTLFPAVCLVVSGGHTQIILMKKIGDYKILGETRDDAAGECFDKTARILGLGYPGGPAIAAEAEKLKTKDYKLKTNLPRPMIYQKNYDFSFSGLKTAVLYNYKNQPEKMNKFLASESRKSKKYIQEMSFEVQQAIIDVLISKTLKVTKEFKAKSIILGGGVTANSELRKQFGEKIKKELPNIQYLTPNIKFCTDNAAMVAVAGYYHWLKGKKISPEKIQADANLRL